jgi:hypothetical protein
MKKTIKLLTILILVVFMFGCEKSSTDPKNNPPVISDVTVSPASVPASGLAAVKVTATDADGDMLSYTFTSDGGTISNGSEPSKLWIAPNIPGTYSVAITVSDGEGGEATDTGNLTVTEAVTQITGVAHFREGVTGNLDNAEVSLYTTYDNWYTLNRFKRMPLSAVGSVRYFTFTGLEPGFYWLDVFQDNDSDGDYSVGDYIGVYGDEYINPTANATSIHVPAGSTVMVEIIMDIRE